MRQTLVNNTDLFPFYTMSVFLQRGDRNTEQGRTRKWERRGCTVEKKDAFAMAFINIVGPLEDHGNDYSRKWKLFLSRTDCGRQYVCEFGDSFWGCAGIFMKT